jgi:hypothetical protein
METWRIHDEIWWNYEKYDGDMIWWSILWDMIWCANCRLFLINLSEFTGVDLAALRFWGSKTGFGQACFKFVWACDHLWEEVLRRHRRGSNTPPTWVKCCFIQQLFLWGSQKSKDAALQEPHLTLPPFFPAFKKEGSLRKRLPNERSCCGTCRWKSQHVICMKDMDTVTAPKIPTSWSASGGEKNPAQRESREVILYMWSVLQVDIPFQGSAWTPWKRMKKDEKGRPVFSSCWT